MAFRNAIKYMEDCGNLTFKSYPFNDVDNIILCMLSYVQFEDIVCDDFSKPITLREAAQRYDDSNNRLLISASSPFMKDYMENLHACANTKRFGDIELVAYNNIVDADVELQMCAVTFLLDNGTAFVAFRGTDNTIAGWKEDFNLSFMEQIPSHVLAMDYVEELCKNTSRKIIIGGHSKGGNLAVYCGVFANEAIKDRIICVYNNDGPGFAKSIVESEEHKKAIAKIKTFVPQSSVVGMLLEHEEPYTVVKSRQIGLMQHRLITWEVTDNKLVELEEVKDSSQIIDSTLKDWVKSLDKEELEEFLDTVFDVINASEAKTLIEIGKNPFTRFAKMKKRYDELDETTREMIDRTMKILADSGTNNFKNYLLEKKEKLFSKGISNLDE